MSKHVYLGALVAVSRSLVVPDPPVEPEPKFVIPAVAVDDHDAEPMIVRLTIPDYGDEVEPIRELHAVALPIDAPIPDAQTLYDDFMSWPFRASADVTNVKDQDVPLSIAGLPDGAYNVQTIVVAGRY